MIKLTYLILITILCYVCYRIMMMNDFDVQELEKMFLKDDVQKQMQFCKRLPDVIVLGVKKCGTITLETFLSYHPNISAGGEIHFFAEDKFYELGMESYVKQMPLAKKDQIVLTKTGAVWYQNDVIKVLERHKKHLPNLKILLIVKDPIVRLVSDVVHFYKKSINQVDINKLVMGTHKKSATKAYYQEDISKMSIREAVFHLSNYSRMWEQLTSVYPRNQILLLDGDVFSENPVQILNEVEDFIGVPRYFARDHFDFSGRKGFPCFKLDEKSKSQCMDKKKARDHPELNEESLIYLRNYFKPIVDKFKDQTGMQLKLS